VVRAAIGRGSYKPLSARQLWTARSVAAAFGAICALALAWVGRTCRGPAAGLLAAVLFAVHPLAVKAYTHALFDIIALAFSVLAVRSLMAVLEPLWGKPASWGRSAARGVGAGVLLALAVGTKMNALVVWMLAAALGVALIARACRGWTRDIAVVAAALGLALSVGGVVFVAINPTLYPDVIGGLRDVLALPVRTTRIQAALFTDFLETPAEKWSALGTLLCGHPAVLTLLVALSLGPTWLGLRRLTPRTVIVLWWWMSLVMVAVWIPFPWSRYALPVLPPALLITADLLVGLFARIVGPIRGQRWFRRTDTSHGTSAPGCLDRARPA
jgi:4-amino-4-deoxy-L-arabinose transferase-like glycosyltransferase